MSLYTPRCLVCGSPFGHKFSCMEDDVRKSEVCSDKCYEIYMANKDNKKAIASAVRKEKT